MPFVARLVGSWTNHFRVLTIFEGDRTPPAHASELDDAFDFARLATAAATRRAYRSDFDIFRAWCDARRVCALPCSPETVAAFLAFEAKRGTKASTIGRRVAAIRYAHRLADQASPTSSEVVKATLRGIRRTKRTTPNRKAPATSDKIVSMAASTGGDLRGFRDRAILLLGFAGAFRRSELVALNLEDLEFCDQGLRVTIRKSKNRPRGRRRHDRYCTGFVRLPNKGLAGLAQSQSDQGRSSFQADQQSQQGPGSSAHRSRCSQYSQGACPAHWAKWRKIQRSLIAVGVFDLGG